MELYFLGVGEACDEQQPNTSIIITGRDRAEKGLLDCGFTTPHLFFQQSRDPDELKFLWISHFHGDHFFGTPLLLLRFWEMQRKEPLAIIGPEGVASKVRQAMELAYPDSLKKLGFDLNFIEVTAGANYKISGFLLRAAETDHSCRSLGLRVEMGDDAIYYSGDGRPTAAAAELAGGCELIVHEAFRADGETLGHGSVRGAVDFARQCGCPKLALVHLKRGDRIKAGAMLQELTSSNYGPLVFLPEPGDLFVL